MQVFCVFSKRRFVNTVNVTCGCELQQKSGKFCANVGNVLLQWSQWCSEAELFVIYCVRFWSLESWLSAFTDCKLCLGIRETTEMLCSLLSLCSTMTKIQWLRLNWKGRFHTARLATVLLDIVSMCRWTDSQWVITFQVKWNCKVYYNESMQCI